MPKSIRTFTFVFCFVAACAHTINQGSDKQNDAAFIAAIQSYNMEAVRKALGYDPKITVYPSLPNERSSGSGVDLYVHGYGESQESIPGLKSAGLLPGTVVGSNFMDAVRGGMPPLTKTSLGQGNDIKTFVTTLKVVDECNADKIHLYGYSRGGSTVVNGLARLKNFEKYIKFFSPLGINKTQAARLLSKVCAGSVVLNCPLVDTRVVIKDKVEKVNASTASYLRSVPILGSLLASSFSSPTSVATSYVLVDCVVAPVVTGGKYAPWKDQAIDSAKSIKGLNLNLLVHFQKDDQVVTNQCDAQFYKNIMGSNSYLVLGDDGGHMHDHSTLRLVLHSFRMNCNGPHHPHWVTASGTKRLTQSQPKENEVDAYVAKYYK